MGNSDWWQELRMRIIGLGIHVLWGKEAFPATMAADVSLMSGAWRMAWIRALGAVGIRQFAAKSGLGYDFICHIGDLAEYPFYHRSAFRDELAIYLHGMAAQQARAGRIRRRSQRRLGCDAARANARPPIAGSLRLRAGADDLRQARAVGEPARLERPGSIRSPPQCSMINAPCT